jgi:hypothetical protein
MHIDAIVVVLCSRRYDRSESIPCLLPSSAGHLSWQRDQRVISRRPSDKRPSELTEPLSSMRKTVS